MFKFPKKQLKFIALASSALALVAACSNGGSSSGSNDVVIGPDPDAVSLQGVPTKGPMALADVNVFLIDRNAADLKGQLIATGTTDDQAQIIDISINSRREDSQYLIEVTSNAQTYDVSLLPARVAPAIPTLRAIINVNDDETLEDIYPTPLTTLALDMASTQMEADESLNLKNALEGSQELIFDTYGLGLAADAEELFSSTPVETDAEGQSKERTLNYRTVSEVVAAIIIDLEEQTGTTNSDDVIKAFGADLSDGTIDGKSGEVVIESFTSISEDDLLETVTPADPLSLPLPGSDTLTIADLNTVLAAETAEINPEIVEPNEEPAAPITTEDTAPIVPGTDTDGDTVVDTRDAFPEDPTESVDSDNDGVGDNSDFYPNDPRGTSITDLDRDEDGVQNDVDDFPNDPTETVDTDGDNVGDNSDQFPENSSESIDSDGDCGTTPQLGDTAGDNCGDNSDIFPNNPFEQSDTDRDCQDFLEEDDYLTESAGSLNNCGDNSDAFPEDPSETVDSDGDGAGDNSDLFPNDASESADTDGDGVGDNADAFPNDANETADTDGDGVGDNADVFPFDATETQDTDSDGTGDNSDFAPTDPAIQNICQTDIADEDKPSECFDDTDGDNVFDAFDDFPNDIAASVDSDGDDFPDAWNTGYSQEDSTTGLVLDLFPTDGSETSDKDGDGVGDNSDGFPDNALESADTDEDCALSLPQSGEDTGNGCADNSDQFPQNSAELLDGDMDCVISGGIVNSVTGVTQYLGADDGNFCADNSEPFPANPDEISDTDGDCGVVDKTSMTAGDGCGDGSDQFPFNENEIADSDFDCDTLYTQETGYPNNPTSGDGCADNSDQFPENSAEVADSDMSCTEESTNNPITGVKQFFGSTAGNLCGDETQPDDSDGDGVNDPDDLFTFNSKEWEDSDQDCDSFDSNYDYDAEDAGDGCGDNSDIFPENSAELADYDADCVVAAEDTVVNSDSGMAITQYTGLATGNGCGDNSDDAIYIGTGTLNQFSAASAFVTGIYEIEDDMANSLNGTDAPQSISLSFDVEILPSVDRTSYSSSRLILNGQFSTSNNSAIPKGTRQTWIYTDAIYTNDNNSSSVTTDPWYETGTGVYTAGTTVVSGFDITLNNVGAIEDVAAGSININGGAGDTGDSLDDKAADYLKIGAQLSTDVPALTTDPNAGAVRCDKSCDTFDRTKLTFVTITHNADGTVDLKFNLVSGSNGTGYLVYNDTP
ncbi:hypothetical protein [Oceanicoccus sagamiensis]|uniref:Uncharacterized protein n=1 Tax=Oceanicoccus sagamiensis TaxID=716816 RepID=A0A1X9NQP0_9GAMM|nr:hypothetical protein [Oceanicoccus sagamiensis]ARN76133.1 hypothetical protein BST96_19745 [Oceanicoccus sagamiensis]